MKPKVFSFLAVLGILLCFCAGKIASEISNEISSQSAFQAAVMARLSKMESEFQDKIKTLEINNQKLLESETVKLNQIITQLQNKVVTLTNKNEELLDKIGYLEGKIVVLTKDNVNSNLGVSLKRSEQAALGQPTGCSDLFNIGHKLNGFYSVRGTDNKIYEVFCDFSQTSGQPGFETRIGQVDVKSSQVYFYVQRSTNYGLTGTTIPFEKEILNEGGALNLASGVFTAPRNGFYFFSFSAIDNNTKSTDVQIRLNATVIGWAYGKDTTIFDTLSLQSTLKLKAGDQISLYMPFGTILGGEYSHFTGFLLEEDFRDSPN